MQFQQFSSEKKYPPDVNKRENPSLHHYFCITFHPLLFALAFQIIPSMLAKKLLQLWCANCISMRRRKTIVVCCSYRQHGKLAPLYLATVGKSSSATMHLTSKVNRRRGWVEPINANSMVNESSGLRLNDPLERKFLR
jgi:ribosomal protein L36